MSPRFILATVLSLVAAIVVVLGVLAAQQLGVGSEPSYTTAELPTAESSFSGFEIINPPRPMPDFELMANDGEPLQLSDLQGKPTLLFFGFTHCPDICPLTLSEYRAVHDQLDARGDDVNYVFVSVDGARDTISVLDDYLALRRVHDFAIGLTGSEQDVRRIGADYGVKFFYGQPDDRGNYNIDHTPSMFLLNETGEWIGTFNFGTPADIISDYLNSYLDSI